MNVVEQIERPVDNLCLVQLRQVVGNFNLCLVRLTLKFFIFPLLSFVHYALHRETE